MDARELKQPMPPTDALEYERYQSARRDMSDAEFRAFKHDRCLSPSGGKATPNFQDRRCGPGGPF